MTAFASFARKAFDPSSSQNPLQSVSIESPVPTGACNFRPLSDRQSSLSQTCGCQSFWLNRSLGDQHNQVHSSQNFVCFCGHHACYHTFAEPTSQPKAADTVQPIVSRTCEWLPGTHPAPAASQFNLPRKNAFGLDAMEAEQRNADCSKRDLDYGSGEHGRSIHSSRSLAASPAIYQESWGLRQLTNPSVRYEPKSSHLQTISDDETLPHSAVPPEDMDEHTYTDCGASATELATPNADSPLTAAQALPSPQYRRSLIKDPQSALASKPSNSFAICRDGLSLESKSSKSLDPPPRMTRFSQPSVNHKSIARHISDLKQGLKTLMTRTEALEGASFPHYSFDGLSDKLDLFEGRILDLEQKVDDIELMAFQERSRECSSTAHSGSMMHVRNNEEVSGSCEISIQFADPHLDSTAEQDFRRDLFTVGRPLVCANLNIEIVVLPWGRNLDGIWTKLRGPFRQPCCHGKIPPNSAFPRTQDCFLCNRANVFKEWRPPTCEIVTPQACAPTTGSRGRAYRRLESRGLVGQTILSENCAINCYAAITSACAEVFRTLHSSNAERNVHDEHSKNCSSSKRSKVRSMLGLEGSFIPLRKVHKSSRLRFLTEPELLNPALWTAEYLLNTICMKVPSMGLVRLYVSTQSAYMQHEGDSGWSWQRLRELPRHYQINSPDHEESLGATPSGVGEADALESCWTWDAKLDGSNSKIRCQGTTTPHASPWNSSADPSSYRSNDLSAMNGSFERSTQMRPNAISFESLKRSQGRLSEENHDLGSPSSSDEPDYAPVTPISEVQQSCRPSGTSRLPAKLHSFPRVNCELSQRGERKSSLSSRDSTPFSIAAKRRRLPESLMPTPKDCKSYIDRSFFGEADVDGSTSRLAAEVYATPHSNINAGREFGNLDANTAEAEAPPASSIDTDDTRGSRNKRFVNNLEQQTAVALSDEEAWEGVADIDQF